MVWTFGADSVKLVYHGEYPCLQGYFSAFQTTRVTAAVPIFVVTVRDIDIDVNETKGKLAIKIACLKAYGAILIEPGEKP